MISESVSSGPVDSGLGAPPVHLGLRDRRGECDHLGAPRLHRGPESNAPAQPDNRRRSRRHRADRARRAEPRGPVVIEARGVEKTFRIPDQKMDTIKERATHPLTRIQYRELHALRGISFDVHRGEFFAIVGRNGSGKSSLLKIMASIYRADAGRIRMAGRVAPFIELGVGFNPELTARENGMLNGVLMGLDAPRGPPAAEPGDRVRRARGVRRSQAQELLVGDDGPVRVRDHGPGRRRHHADRRGARRRRRGLRPEVPRRVPREARTPARRSCW